MLFCFYTRDHLGSIREVTDNSENLETRYDYDPYGRRSVVAGSGTTAIGYTGHYTHEPSGLVMAPYRFYSPELGRWINRDPIAESGGINLYGYVEGNPINYFDPVGENAAMALPYEAGILIGGGAGILWLYRDQFAEAAMELFNKKEGQPVDGKGKACKESDLTPTGDEAVKEPSKNYPGGESVEETYKDKSGATVTKHTLKDKNGKVREKHYRPGPPKGKGKKQ